MPGVRFALPVPYLDIVNPKMILLTQVLFELSTLQAFSLKDPPKSGETISKQNIPLNISNTNTSLPSCPQDAARVYQVAMLKNSGFVGNKVVVACFIVWGLAGAAVCVTFDVNLDVMDRISRQCCEKTPWTTGCTPFRPRKNVRLQEARRE